MSSTHETSLLAQAAGLTRRGSLHTYLVIRCMVDRDLVADGFGAYAYFRWLDDVLDRQLGERQQRRFNLVKGATHGLSHRLMQMGYSKPHNRHARYRNLYFAGASTHPGTGLPTVLVSGRLVAERCVKDLART